MYVTNIFGECGTGLRAFGSPTVTFPENIAMGNNCSINYDVVIGARAPISIGDRVRVSTGVVIETQYRDPFGSGTDHKAEPICIGDDVDIGTKAVVLGGVTIGQGCVVAAGATVHEDIPPYSLAIGSPAGVVPLMNGRPTADIVRVEKTERNDGAILTALLEWLADIEDIAADPDQRLETQGINSLLVLEIIAFAAYRFSIGRAVDGCMATGMPESLRKLSVRLGALPGFADEERVRTHWTTRVAENALTNPDMISLLAGADGDAIGSRLDSDRRRYVLSSSVDLQPDNESLGTQTPNRTARHC
ncbi:acyltransferase [Antrihabitans cavernicola]|uniref:acyltransferase n=1 Tax=Antrihabitans cavernicola TaxID=2495913 RepID=UPI001658F8AD|nr:acyltransferase [Spelaeibacter cavernicola]